MKKLIATVLLAIIATTTQAAGDVYQLNNPEQQALFKELTQDLRCLVCQNQSLAESNAPLAQDLKQQVYEQVQAGKQKREIIYYLGERYGDFILYKPPFQLNTAILWFSPFFLLTLGLLATLLFVSRQKRATA